jgi:hypothetical protein
LCPRQSEIRGFPAFPWYPDAVKQAVMRWAARSRPALIGYTKTPAVHWFSPRRMARLAEAAGFSGLHDRWDLWRDEEDRVRATLAGVIRSHTALRRAADLLREGSTYLLVR